MAHAVIIKKKSPILPRGSVRAEGSYGYLRNSEELHAEITGHVIANLEIMDVKIYREAEALVNEAKAAVLGAKAPTGRLGVLRFRYRSGQWGPRIVRIRVGRPIEYIDGTRKPRVRTHKSA